MPSSTSSSAPEAPELDIVMPVFNVGAGILAVLDRLERHVHVPFRVLVCFDFDEDTTLPALASRPSSRIALVKNRGQGVVAAVTSGLDASRAPAVLVMPAHDDYNAPRIDAMLDRLRAGFDVVCASRFMPGARVADLPRAKSILARTSSFVLRRCARLPVHDVSNGLRLFSRRVVERIPIESSRGHAYSLELLVKCHRLGWPIAELPADWQNRNRGKSRFRVFAWLPAYLRWFAYALATRFLRRGPHSVRLRS